jgi:MFS family permease
MFFAARLLLGSVAAVTGPAVPSLVGDLVPAARRARAFGLVESGQLVGGGLGFIMAAAITTLVSFRWCFWLLAVVAVILAAAFRRLPEPPRTTAGPAEEGENEADQGTRVQRPAREAGTAPSRQAILREDPGRMLLWEVARYFIRVRTDLIMVVSRAVGDFFLAAIGIFGVLFATKQYGLSQGAADLAMLVLGTGALAGFLLVGRAGDILLRKRHLNGRLWLGRSAISWVRCRSSSPYAPIPRRSPCPCLHLAPSSWRERDQPWTRYAWTWSCLACAAEPNRFARCSGPW